MGQFWDAHDVTLFWEQTQPVDFTIDISSEATYYPLDSMLSEGVRSMAKRRGVSAETLLNLWIQERLQQEAA